MVVAGDNKIVYGVNPANGELKWSYPSPSAVLGQPVTVGNDVVFASTDNKLNVITADTGKPVWERPYNVFDGISGSIASFGNSILFFNNRYELASIDLTTQKTNWKQKFTQLPPNPTPVVSGDTIYAISGPFLIALNANNGVARWQVATGMQLIQAPSVSSDAIFVMSQDGKVMAYAPNRDKLTKSPIEVGSLAVTRPTAVGKNLIVPTSAGGIALVDAEKGVVTWNYLIRPLASNTTSTASQHDFDRVARRWRAGRVWPSRAEGRQSK
jgi:outer membrane protein assembly factor BamB